MTTPGEYIRYLRLEQGMSGARLARQCGIRRQHLYAIETGRVQVPSPALLIQLSVALQVTMRQLVEPPEVEQTEALLELLQEARSKLDPILHLDEASEAHALIGVAISGFDESEDERVTDSTDETLDGL